MQLVAGHRHVEEAGLRVAGQEIIHQPGFEARRKIAQSGGPLIREQMAQFRTRLWPRIGLKPGQQIVTGSVGEDEGRRC
jgi:hypothetical protein